MARTLGLSTKSEFNVTTSSQSLHSHRKGNEGFPTIQQSQVINAPSPSYFGGNTSVLETPQPLQSFRGSEQSPSTLDRSWLVDPPSTSLSKNLSSSRYSPRIIRGTLESKKWSLHFDHFHPTLIDGTYCLIIQDSNPISCQSRHGPRICRQHITVQKSVVNVLQPEFSHRPITSKESVCF